MLLISVYIAYANKCESMTPTPNIQLIICGATATRCFKANCMLIGKLEHINGNALLMPNAVRKNK